MKEFMKPEFHFVRNPGGLSGDEMAKLSDSELAEYLNEDSMNKEKKKFRIRSGYILREIVGEYAIVPVDVDSRLENTVMSPNDSAVFIWKAFEESSTIEDVVVKGMQEYDVAKEKIRKSVEHFVEDTLEYKILEEVE